MLQESQVGILEHLNILQTTLSRRLVQFRFDNNLMFILPFTSCINMHSMGPNGIVKLLYNILYTEDSHRLAGHHAVSSLTLLLTRHISYV